MRGIRHCRLTVVASRLAVVLCGVLTSIVVLGVAPLPAVELALPAGASPNTCTAWTSPSDPPSTIRVLIYATHNAAGQGSNPLRVDTVPFATYVKDVLPNEWPSSWGAESLRSGAIAAKSYGWYFTMYSGHGGNFPPVTGPCYDVTDDIGSQRYSAGSNTQLTNLAVDFTWATVVWQNSDELNAGYQATLTGSQNEACGAGLNNYPNKLSQWGSKNCASAGYNHRQILGLYYWTSPIGFLTPSAVATVSTLGSSIQYQVGRATGGTYYFRRNNGNPFGSWQAVPGSYLSNPAVSSSAAGWMDVYGVGLDHQMWHVYYNGSTWSALEPLGGTFNSAPAAAMWGSSTYHLFAVETDGKLWHNFWPYNGGWRGWIQEQSGQWMSGPAVAAWASGRLDIFVQDMNGAFQKSAYAGGYTGWEYRGGAFASGPAMASQGVNSLNIAGRGLDGGVWQQYWAGGWGPAPNPSWGPLGGVVATDLSLASFGPDTLDVVGRAPDGGIYEKQWRNGAWTPAGWFTIGWGPP